MGVMASAYEFGGGTNISKDNWLIKQLQCDWVAKKLRKHFLGKLHVITYLVFYPLHFFRWPIVIARRGTAQPPINLSNVLLIFSLSFRT